MTHILFTRTFIVITGRLVARSLPVIEMLTLELVAKCRFTERSLCSTPHKLCLASPGDSTANYISSPASAWGSLKFGSPYCRQWWRCSREICSRLHPRPRFIRYIIVSLPGKVSVVPLEVLRCSEAQQVIHETVVVVFVSTGDWSISGRVVRDFTSSELCIY